MRLEVTSGDHLIQCPSSKHGQPETVALDCVWVGFDGLQGLCHCSFSGELPCSTTLRIPQSQRNPRQVTGRWLSSRAVNMLIWDYFRTNKNIIFNDM